MKKILLTLSIFFALNAYAQHNPKTLIAEDELPTMVERIIERRDSVMNDGYKIRKIKSHINLEFASSANAYFSAGQFDEMSFKMNRVRLEIYGRWTAPRCIKINHSRFSTQKFPNTRLHCFKTGYPPLKTTFS